jgi:uncharacterized SAM-binding protein YcdF (DUF218 family)
MGSLNQFLKRQYAAIIVLSGGIIKQGDRFVSTTYADSDPFGMLGGRIRVIAAAELYKRCAVSTFVFTTGVTAKTSKIFGTDVPTEATVYAQEFLALVDAAGAVRPTVILEDHSSNTTQNIQELLTIITSRGWQRVAILSSDYHIARVAALVSLLGPTISKQTDIIYLSAEEVVQQQLPGVYDQQIQKAYASKEAHRRLQNEHKGLQALLSSSYNRASSNWSTRLQRIVPKILRLPVRLRSYK